MILSRVPRFAFCLLPILASACHLYFESDGDEEEASECRGAGCGSYDPSVWPDAGNISDAGIRGEGGPFCTSSWECGPGCYCNSAGQCEELPPPVPDAAPFTCADLSSDEAACLASAECSAVYRGIGCASSDGSTCSGQAADCSCESFAFDDCSDNE